MQRSLRTTEIHQAYFWTCDDCGQDNFERAVRVDPESVEGRDIGEFAKQAISEAGDAAEALGIVIDGDWLMAPSQVKCAHCGAEFQTET
jgi:hypothetical protein